MISFTHKPSDHILTKNGLQPLDVSLIDSYAYDCRSQDFCKIVNIKENICNKFATIEYNTHQYVTVPADASVVNGDQVIKITDLMKTKDFRPIDIAPIEIQIQQEPMLIDPYTIGIFLTFGDFTRYEISIPTNFRIPILNNLYNAGFETAPTGREGYYGIVSILHPKTLIPWHEFFPFYIQHGLYKMPNYPDNILCMTYKERMRFINGIFDCAGKYNSELNTVVVPWDEMIPLIRLRNLLLSVGVVSCVESTGFMKGPRYQLRVMWDYVPDRFLFSDPIKIWNIAVLNDKHKYVIHHHQKLMIRDIKIHTTKHRNRSVINVPYFDRDNVQYIGNEFIPIISSH